MPHTTIQNEHPGLFIHNKQPGCSLCNKPLFIEIAINKNLNRKSVGHESVVIVEKKNVLADKKFA